MINFVDVYSSDSISDIAPPTRYAIAFFGKPLDDRGNASVNFSKNNSDNPINTEYDYTKFSLLLNSIPHRINALKPVISELATGKVLLDSTTLNCIEMAVIIRALIEGHVSIEFDVLYTEPIEYTPKIDDLDLCNSHAFQLSSSLQENISQVPGFSRILNSDQKAHLLIFSGFEKERLGGMLSGMESYHIDESTLVLGIPPFKPSMDIHSIMQSIPLLLTKENIKTVDFTGANNPVSTYRLIDRTKQSISTNEILDLSPIGPKPSAFACALYAANDKSVSLRYDFPELSSSRSIGVGKSTLYSIKKS